MKQPINRIDTLLIGNHLSIIDFGPRKIIRNTRIADALAKTLRLHAWGILAYYDYPISTGPLEGTNNKIKTMKRQAYGFRDPEFLRLKILGIHQTRYALVGWTDFLCKMQIFSLARGGLADPLEFVRAIFEAQLAQDEVPSI